MKTIARAATAAAIAGGLVLGTAPLAQAYRVRECTVAGAVKFRVSSWYANGWTTYHYKALPPYKKIARPGPDSVYRWTDARIPRKGLRNTRTDGYLKVKGDGLNVVEGRWYGTVGPFFGYSTCSVKL